MASDRHRRRPRRGGLVDRTGRGYPPSIDLRLRVSKPDRRGASLAGDPDRRPSRPAVSPIYAQGSWYGTNRVVAGGPGRFTGPATPLLSTTRAAQPPGRDPSHSRSHVVRTGRVSRKNVTWATPYACDPRMATDPRRWVARTGPFHRNCRPEAGMRAWLALRPRRARPAPTPRGALSTSRSRVQSCDSRPGRRSARVSAPAHIREEAQGRRKPKGSPGRVRRVATSRRHDAARPHAA